MLAVVVDFGVRPRSIRFLVMLALVGVWVVGAILMLELEGMSGR